MHRVEVVERLQVGVVARRPAARRRERHDGARAPARGELQREVAAERVAGDVRRLEAGLVQRALDRVTSASSGAPSAQRRPAGVADSVGASTSWRRSSAGSTSSHVRHVSVRAVQEQERLTGAAAVRRRERGRPRRRTLALRLLDGDRARRDAVVVASRRRSASSARTSRRRARPIAGDAPGDRLVLACPLERGRASTRGRRSSRPRSGRSRSRSTAEANAPRGGCLADAGAASGAVRRRRPCRSWRSLKP